MKKAACISIKRAAAALYSYQNNGAIWQYRSAASSSGIVAPRHQHIGNISSAQAAAALSAYRAAASVSSMRCIVV